MNRKHRKKVSMRGHRKQGHGNTKNAKKGGGKRGGTGKAGSHKHTVTKYLATFTKHGFTNQIRREIQVINLNALNDSLDKELSGLKTFLHVYLKREGNVINIDFKNKFKLLGEGNLTHKINLKNAKVSESVKEKLLANGSQLELPKEIEEVKKA